ncbi:MAG: ATP-binding protein [Planctomycetaceae bacterium]
MNDMGSFEDTTVLDLIRLLNETDEHTRCEAKTSQQLGRSLLETICAFANEPDMGGGYILLGVGRDDSSLWPNYSVIGVDDSDQLQADIATQCRTVFSRPVRPRIRAEQIHERSTLVLYVPESQPSEKPVYFVNEGLPRGAYRRIGSTDQRCTEDDLLVFYRDRQVETYDRTPVRDAVSTDIDPDTLALYRSMRREVRPDAEELLWDDHDLLCALSCGCDTAEGFRPTYAGILLFGTQRALRRFFPMMRIDYLRVPTLEWVADPVNRYSSLEVREPLIRAIAKIRAMILDDLPRSFSLPPGELQREDVPALPDRVVREVIVNAVMHRCYRTQGPISVLRYPNRIEVRNPGHSLVSEERLGQPGSETRNPAIAAVLYDIGLAETKGSGIRAMQGLMQEAQLAPPVFESDREGNRFVAYLLLHHFLTEQDINWLANFSQYDLSDDDRLALVAAREMGAIDNSTYRNLTGVDTLTASTHLRKLRDSGLLEMRGKGARTHYKPTAKLLRPGSVPRGGLAAQRGGLAAQRGGLAAQRGELNGEAAETPSDSVLPKLPDEVAERLPKIGGKAKRLDVRRAILELCQWRPLTPTEIAGYLGRRRVKRLVADYVSPMLEEGLLERTFPQTPSHPDQRYRTSGAGAGELI